MKKNMNIPEPVQKFIDAVKENAKQVWNEPGDDDFIDSLLYVDTKKDGSIVICDNYEKFFQTIYRIDTTGNWHVREMYSERSERMYSFEAAMVDASIMYTG